MVADLKEVVAMAADPSCAHLMAVSDVGAGYLAEFHRKAGKQYLEL